MPNLPPNLSPIGISTNPKHLFTIPNHVKQLDGLYCLNDLHKASGGQHKHTPNRFIKLQKTQRLIQAYEHFIKTQNTKKCSGQTPNPQNTKKCFENSNAIKVIHGGNNQGTYAVKHIAIAYAEWIDPYFYLMVLERLANPPTYTQRINALCHEITLLDEKLSHAGRVLCIGGKQIKPAMQAELTKILNNQQLTLQGV